MKFTDSITSVKGIGEKTASLFRKLNIETVFDLVNHFPRDYESGTPYVQISDLKTDEKNTIHAQVLKGNTLHVKNHMTITTIYVKDASGECQLIYFNMPFMKNALQAGKWYFFKGNCVSRKGILTLEHPKVMSEAEYEASLQSMNAIYPTTKGLTSAFIQKSVQSALEKLEIPEILPFEILRDNDLCSLTDAYHGIHNPVNHEELVNARKRLVFDEFLIFILSVQTLKNSTEKEINDAPMMKVDAVMEFINKLPYKLTNAQLRVWKEIEEDLSSNHIMNRLVQGDVGSGKTIVAILAMFMCVMNHKQAAFMAPTEVLAKQHYESILELTNTYQLPFSPVLLTGALSAKEKRETKEKIKSGECNVIIGTQALIQEPVDFYDLKLVITDEQHRFGVKQRETLAKKGIQTHILVMSATPIPRTLALILYGDLDISVMDELPANRLPIKNCVVGPEYRKKAYEFISKEVASGRQVYVICPMVEPEEETESPLDIENVLDYTQKLKQIFADTIRVEALHGKMKSSQKNEIMEAFGRKEIDVLVSTTVIEVGINVPNATVMMVENAQRFGLAQLHQLRGRVGRGKHQSYCIFVNTSKSREAKERLEVLNKSNDGFFISSEDMKMRGPGDLFGIRQSGAFAFRLGDVFQDALILQSAQLAATRIFEDYFTRSNEQLSAFWKYYDENIFYTVDFINI